MTMALRKSIIICIVLKLTCSACLTFSFLQCGRAAINSRPKWERIHFQADCCGCGQDCCKPQIFIRSLPVGFNIRLISIWQLASPSTRNLRESKRGPKLGHQSDILSLLLYTSGLLNSALT